MSHLYRKPRDSRGLGLSILLGLGVALLIFLLVPLTQLLQPEPKTVHTIEAVAPVSPPPPPPPVDPPPPPPEPEREPPPELETPPPMPTLDQLEVSLHPGTGGGFQIGTGLGLEFTTESAEQLIDIFDFSELDEIPRLMREGRFRYPTRAPRGTGNASVRLLVFIDERGRVTVEEVLEYTHREFIEPVRTMAESSRFSVPLRGGEPVRSKYEWVIQVPLER